MKGTFAAVAAFAIASSAQAATFVTAARMLDPVKGVILDNPLAVIGNDVGRITPGHYGNILAVAGGPTRDTRLLEHPVWLLKGGQVMTGPSR